MPSFGDALRRRMLLIYLGVLLGMYAAAVVAAFGQRASRGECVATGLCAVGLAVAWRHQLSGRRYAAALFCAGAAPAAALLFHDQAVAQVWALIPLMFLAVFVRTWHRAMVARAFAAVVAASAVLALVVAPAEVPVLWPVFFVVCIGGAAEVFGVLQSTLLEAALRDPLTSAWNRAGLDRQAGTLISRAQRRDQLLAVIVLDIDEFKTINDRDGHLAGDRVLTRLAADWLSRLPGASALGRTGGDEFVAVLEVADEEYAHAVADRLGGDGSVRVSAGVAVGRPHDSQTFEEMLISADADLYRRKRERKHNPPSQARVE